MNRKITILCLFLVVILSYNLAANDGRHHWHEFRYLYSATFYSPTELMQGVFDPGPAPVRPTEDVAAWYCSELLHISILRNLVKLFGVGIKSYKIIKTLYTTMLLMAVAFVAITLRNLGMSSRLTSLTTALLLFSPLYVYLGFKSMGELPSLFFATGALALYTTGLRYASKRFTFSILTGIAIAASALSSVKMPLLFLGFWVAFILVWAPRSKRRSVALTGILTWMICFTAWAVGFHILGGSLGIYLHALAGFLNFTKPLPMWMFAVFNVALFGMGLWLFIPIAWFSGDYRSRRFFLLWLVVSTVPVLITTLNFLEPRYLVPGLIPFVGLAALGLDVIWERFSVRGSRFSARAAIVVLLGTTLLGGTAVAQSFMPYETDANQLVQIVRAEASSFITVAIFVPWNYSDFHLLRFLFPEKPIYLVQSAADVRGELVEDPVWTKRRANNYGDHFLPDAKTLSSVSEQKMLYIGWTILPSLQNLRDFLMRIRLDRLAGRLEPSNFMNHMTQSWLWDHPRFSMHKLARYGQYHVFEVRRIPVPTE